jgi:hypothetical protein
MSDRIDHIESRIALLAHQLEHLQGVVSKFSHLPAWRADIESGLVELRSVCVELGYTLEAFYDNNAGGTNQANPVRDAVIKELAHRGWPASRIGLIARMSERAVRRVLSRARG